MGTMTDTLFVKHVAGSPPKITGGGVAYGSERPLIEQAQVCSDGASLTLETDLFASRPLHVLVRDGTLWAASTLKRLTQERDLPHGFLSMGACVALAVAPARRPSLCASGLSLLPNTKSVSEAGKIRTQPGSRVDVLANALLLGLLKQALARRVAGNSVALALSGGFDSAALLALLTEMGVTVRAYTMADSAAAGEIEAAAAIAKHFGAAHEIIEVREESLPELADSTIRACEILIYNARAMAKFAFHLEVAKRERVLLSGVGADDLFMGDPAALALTRQGIPQFVARLLPEVDLAMFFLRSEWSKRVKQPDWRRDFSGANSMNASRNLVLRTLLPHSGLPVEMLTAATHGLEVRAPFLDRDVAAFALAQSEEQLVRDGHGKWLLRDALADLLPREVCFAAKTAKLAPPGGNTTRARRDWIAWLDRALAYDRLERLEVIDSGRVRRELIQYGKLHNEAPRRVLLDRVLMKLASLTVLQEYWA